MKPFKYLIAFSLSYSFLIFTRKDVNIFILEVEGIILRLNIFSCSVFILIRDNIFAKRSVRVCACACVSVSV